MDVREAREVVHREDISISRLQVERGQWVEPQEPPED